MIIIRSLKQPSKVSDELPTPLLGSEQALS